MLKNKFLNRGLEVREIIPFPVWIFPFSVLIIPFSVLKINFEPLGSNMKHLVKGVFLSEA